MVIATTRLGELGNHGDSLQRQKVGQYFSQEGSKVCRRSRIDGSSPSPFSKDQEAVGARPPHSCWFEKKNRGNSHALGTIQTRHTHSLWIKTKRKKWFTWPAIIVWLPYCLGTLDAMCTTSSVSNWKDKKPHKIAMTNTLPNCEPITVAIFRYYFF